MSSPENHAPDVNAGLADINLEPRFFEIIEKVLEYEYRLLEKIQATDQKLFAASTRQRSSLRARLENSDQVVIGNGFSFVIDRRPTGQESEDIPSFEFTQYFSRGLVPVAAKDHREHEHDIGHGIAYEQMFQIPMLADLVRRAATSALSDPESCRRFTGAIDGLSNDVRNLLDGSQGMPYVRGVKLQLKRLLALDPDLREAEVTEWDNTERTLLEELHVPEYEAAAKTFERAARFGKHIGVYRDEFINDKYLLTREIDKISLPEFS